MDNIIGGSSNNQGINNIESTLYKDKTGKVVISSLNAEAAPAVIVSNNQVVIASRDLSAGMSVKDGSVNIQGTAFLTSKAENVKKGEYSENTKSSKIFTYQETVLLESVPKSLMSEMSGKMGINLSNGMDGNMPIMTDIASGPLPHFHNISMKHVHRIEPAYLYRVPAAVNIIKGALKQLQQFFSI